MPIFLKCAKCGSTENVGLVTSCEDWFCKKCSPEKDKAMDEITEQEKKSRTPQEIIDRANEVQGNDLFGTEFSDLIIRLPFEDAKQFLLEDAVEADWKQDTRDLKEVMIDYMEFAWEKANDCRGLSASRTMSHYAAWLWLDGAPASLIAKTKRYNFYGKDVLVEICNYLGLDSNKWDNGERTNYG